MEIGPYTVIGTLFESPDERVLIGYDKALDRQVWIWPHAHDDDDDDDDAAVSDARRDLARLTRLRWINGRRSSGKSWDAYSAIDGQPLLEATDETRDWRGVRFWALDILTELEEGVADRTIRDRLDASYFWLGRDGRIRILDFPCSSPTDRLPDFRPADLDSVQSFMGSLIDQGLAQTSPTSAVPPPPVGVRNYFEQFRSRTFTSVSSMVDQGRRVIELPTVVPLSRRAGNLAILTTFTLMAALVGGVIGYQNMLTAVEYPDWTRLDRHLRRLEAAQIGGETVDSLGTTESLEVYVAGTYRDNLADSQKRWPEAFPVSDARRELGFSVSERLGNVTEADLLVAEAELSEYLAARSAEFTIRTSLIYPALVLVHITALFLCFFAISGVVGAFLFRGGPYLYLFGCAVVTTDGKNASRLRATARSIIAWLPVVGCVPYARLNNYFLADLNYASTALVISLLGMFVMGVGLIWTIVRPERGLQDEIAGTYIVPR